MNIFKIIGRLVVSEKTDKLLKFKIWTTLKLRKFIHPRTPEGACNASPCGKIYFLY